ncbi:MAG: PilN domain-containing protein [Phycisphaerales bacterium]|nr:PilN domain-containing protein [Phycisphaerales bacterium]
MNDSFLPNEYTEQRIDRRTHVMAMLLFIVVLAAVFAAFLWKRNEWNRVEQIRRDVELRYEAAGAEVEQLMVLKVAQQSTVNRAELAAALVEKVPRSILLAELINHMPSGLGLLDLKLESTRIVDPDKNKPTKGRKQRAGTRPKKQNERPEAPRYNTKLSLTGFAPTDVHVSEFLAALNDHPLLENVNLVSSQETVAEDRTIREFKLTAALPSDADVRVLANSQDWNPGDRSWISMAEESEHE